jgi:integrase
MDTTANPAPLGLMGFGMTTVLLNIHNAGFFPISVLNRTAASVVEAQRGEHPTHVFAYRGKPTSHMLNGAWRRARTAAGLPQVRVHDLKHYAECRIMPMSA